MPLLQRRVSEVQTHPAAPGIAARHIDKQRVLLWCAVREHIGVMRLTLRNCESQNQARQKTTKVKSRAFHGVALQKGKALPTLSHNRVAA
jgi:hypothetical protein